MAGLAGLGGCAASVGLVDRVKIVRKRLTSVGDGDPVVIAERWLTEQGTVASDVSDAVDVSNTSDSHDSLGDEPEPLTVAEDLEGEFETLRYEIWVCKPGTESGGESTVGVREGRDEHEAQHNCQTTLVLRDDFNNLEVGDIADLRIGEETAGVVSVVERGEVDPDQ